MLVVVNIANKCNHQSRYVKIVKKNRLSKCLKRKVANDVCEKHMKLISQQVRSDDIDTLTNADIRYIRAIIYNLRESQFYPSCQETYR